MPDMARPPLPYDFLPPVASFMVTSTDMAAGETLANAQVYNGMGHSGGNISPQLSWEGYPDTTRGFAVTCFDPDAPTGSGFWHWSLFDIPAGVNSLPAGAGSGAMPGLPSGTIHARNDYGTKDFGGAAPPQGDAPHRYVFAVHAVDIDKLGPDADATPAVVGFMLRFHTVARGLLIPVYGA